MKITKVEVVHSKKKVTLSEDYKPAWREPDGKPIKSFRFSFYRIHTDEGIVGLGPYRGDPDPFVKRALTGLNPFYVGKFWSECMKGRELASSRGTYGGLEVALLDIVGKALGKPIYKILGACRDRVMAYAATNRLLKTEEHIKQVSEIMNMGFKAVKLRLHRSDPRDDLAVVKAVRDAVGEDLKILVDANQNNRSINYNYWSRKTALWMAKELDKLNVYFLEEPLARRDVEGLAELAASVEMFIAGGEHSANIYEFKEHVIKGSYDILQPDLILGDIGITGIRKIAVMADYFGRMVVPHVCSAGSVALSLPAALQAVSTIENCPMLEYPFDPPILTIENQQLILKEAISIEKDGCLKVPDKPGLGIEIDEEKVGVFS
jgi:L-alanine-DL-glutamate epimerase-like enolase superfamily enzyme